MHHKHELLTIFEVRVVRPLFMRGHDYCHDSYLTIEFSAKFSLFPAWRSNENILKAVKLYVSYTYVHFVSQE